MTEVQASRASLHRRVCALLYDNLLLIAIAWAVSAIYLGTEVLLFDAERFSGQYQYRSRPLLQFLLLTSYVGFYTYFWRYHGRTLGMQSWRLMIQSNDGKAPSLGQCLVRCAAATLSAACAGLGYWWALIDKEGRSWHDRLSGTRIIRVEQTRALHGPASDDPV